ncbi:MAG: trypsin-like peptidase domain-containing protein [Candidatus Limnocylindrales bacterium]
MHSTSVRRPRIAVALAGALSISGLMAAAPGAALGAAGDDELIIDIIEQNMPAVVTIQAPAGSFGDLDGLSPDDIELPDDAELPEDFEIPEGLGDLQELLPEGFGLPPRFGFGGTGSGVIVDPDGLIITNGHVVGNAREVTVILDDGRVLDGTVTGVDTLTDFAFVEVEEQGLPAVTLGDSSVLRVGQTAISIGNPLGRFPSSAAVGIVSGLDRSIGVFGNGGGERLNHLIQTDAAINSGNSGGALFDGDGELIGITTAEAGVNDGIGFALPIDLAKPIIEQALAGEPIARPYVGVVYTEIDAQLALDEALPVSNGAWINGSFGDSDPVVDGGPADEAGLEAGDIITAVNGVPVDDTNPLDLQVLRYAPGEAVSLDVLRDGENLTLEATLGTRPAEFTS